MVILPFILSFILSIASFVGLQAFSAFQLISLLYITELSEQSGREARAYFLWFEKQIGKRIDYLHTYLLENKANFNLDYSEKSLSDLWIWFRSCMKFVKEKVNEDKQTEEELYCILDAIEMDISIYFAETLIHNHPQLYWDYVKKGTKLYA